MSNIEKQESNELPDKALTWMNEEGIGLQFVLVPAVQTIIHANDNDVSEVMIASSARLGKENKNSTTDYFPLKRGEIKKQIEAEFSKRLDEVLDRKFKTTCPSVES